VTGILPLFSMLKTRMHWYQARQKLLSENVANADTPKFKPHDLRPPVMPGQNGTLSSVSIERTNPAHLSLAAFGGEFDGKDARRFEATPSGNAVVLEDEMAKSAQNQADYQMAATLYARGLSLLKTAVGRG
jgi:flagellar basal-body rod protein FlgB